jgi:hypothetical protein
MRVRNLGDTKGMKPEIQKQVAERIRVKPKAKVLEYPFSFSIPVELRSKNDFTGEGARWKRKAAKQEFIRCISWLVGNYIQPPECKQFVTYTRVLGKGKKLWDSGNMEGGDVIQLQDSLKQLGFWQDDSRKYLEARCKEDDTERPDKGYTKIHIQLGGWE